MRERVMTAAMVLSSLYLNPPNQPLRENLQDDSMLDAWPLTDAASASGIATLRGGTDTEEELARDHLYLFTGVGAPLAQPYESPYFTGLVNDERTFEVERVYGQLGFKVPDTKYPADHIGYEIAYIAEAARLRAPVKDFLDQHLNAFAPQVIAATREHATTAVYRALPDLTQGLIDSAYEL